MDQIKKGEHRQAKSKSIRLTDEVCQQLHHLAKHENMRDFVQEYLDVKESAYERLHGSFHFLTSAHLLKDA